MIKDILLFGDIVPFVYCQNEIDLTMLHDKVSKLDLKPEDTLRIGIHSMGGCTVTAFSMYNFLRRLVNDGTVSKIITRVEGYCASSGVILLLAGDERIGNDFAEPFVHQAWTYLDSGNAQDLKKVASELEATDKAIATLYSNVTDITFDLAMEYMTSTKWITAKECMSLKFYTKLENVQGAEARLEVFNSLKRNKTKQNKMSKTNSILNSIKELLKTKNNKIIKDGNGKDVDFYELEDGSTPAIGDVATIDGSPAGEAYDGGVVVMADGSEITFDGEVVTAIKEAEVSDDEDDKDVVIANLKAEIETLKQNSVTTQNSLKKRLNKANTEKASAIEILTKINSIKDEQIKAILNGEEDEEDEDIEDLEDLDDDEDLDDNGFPIEAPKSRQNVKQNKKKVEKSETGDVLELMKLNLFKSRR